MKRIICIVLSLIIFSTLFSATTVSATVKKGKCGKNITYTLDSNKKELTVSGKGKMYGYLGGYPYNICNDELKLSYGNYKEYVAPWLHLGPCVVEDCDDSYLYSSGWSNLTVEKGITSIGSFAFGGYGIKSITLPKTLKTIYGGAFHHCAKLKTITIPDNVKTISSKVDFYKDDKEYYREGAFTDCDCLDDVIISEKSKLKTIGCKTFLSSGVEYFNSKNELPKVTHVGASAFKDCYYLKKISLPKAEVYKSAFEFCERLKKADVSGTKKIRAYTFLDCRALENVKLGDKLTWIGTESFSCCYSLKKIIIPKNVEEIRYNAFKDDEELKTVIIESQKLKAVRTDAFKNVNKNVVFKVPKSKLEQYKALISPNAPKTAKFVGI